MLLWKWLAVYRGGGNVSVAQRAARACCSARESGVVVGRSEWKAEYAAGRGCQERRAANRRLSAAGAKVGIRLGGSGG